MKKSILSLVLLSSISIAHATGASNNCNGSGSCPQNETTTVNSTNQGGVGYGGAGGSATSVSTGGSATGGNSTAYGGTSNVDVRNSSSNINANTVKNESSNVQGQIQGQKQSTNNANNSTNSVTVQGDNFESARNPVNTAYAPPVAATANCALGVSGGVSFVGFSGSFGKSYVDENCAMLEKVRAVSQVLGDKATAEALLCLDPKYAKARLNAGRACPVEQE